MMSILASQKMYTIEIIAFDYLQLAEMITL